MGSSMLTLVTQVTSELGVPTPATVAGNTNQDVTQILALMNATGYELLRKADWQALTKVYNFTTSYLTTTGTWTTSNGIITGIPSTAALDTTYMIIGSGFPLSTFVQSVDSGTQVTANMTPTTAGTVGTLYFQKAKYALPTDYESMVPRTQWDRSKHWEMLGPEDAQQWEYIQSGYIATGPRVRWRIFGDYFAIWPGFSNAESLSFEYRSKGWAMTAAGVVKNSLTIDTDTCIYGDRLMVLSTKLKYMQSKGFDTSAIYQDYMTELETSIAQDTSSANLSFAPSPSSVLIGWSNIPDSGYGL
jgi:hypothetical protein